MGFIPDELDGAIVTNDFPLFTLSEDVDPEYFSLFSQTAYFDDACKRASEGSTNRKRLKLDKFYMIKFSLPNKDEQQRIVSILNRIKDFRSFFNEASSNIDAVSKFLIHQIFVATGEKKESKKIGV